MNIIINEKLIKRNKRIGNISSIVGISILVLGLILNINPTPERTMIAFGALIVGFIISQVSTYFVTRFSRSPRYDEIFTENLIKLNNKYSFYIYRGPVPMILVGPSAIWIPVPVSASGEIYFDKKWRQKGGSFLLKLFGQENLGRPALDVESNEKAVRKFLSDHFDVDAIPPIKSILVSLHPKAKIGDVEEAPYPIVEAEALRRKIRKNDRDSGEDITKETLDKINDLLENS